MINLSMVASRRNLIGSIICGALVVCLTVSISCRLLDNGIVSGTDGGNWLAYGHELMGEEVKAANSTYPPLVPFFVGIVSLGFSELFALSAMAVITLTLISVCSLFLIRRTIGTALALIVTTGILSTGISIEILAWGGYPQLISESLLIVSIALALDSLKQFRLKKIIASAFLASVCIATWTPVLLFWGIAVTVIHLVTITGNRSAGLYRVAIHYLLLMALTALFCIPYYSIYYRSREIIELRSWDPQGLSITALPDTIGLLYRWWPEWQIYVVAGIVVYVTFLLLKRVVRTNVIPCLLVLMSLSIASITVFLVTGELRSLRLLTVGGWGILAVSLSSSINEGVIHFRDKTFALPLRVVSLLILLLVPLTQGVIYAKHGDSLIEYYRVVDTEVLEALDWLEEHHVLGTNAVESGSGKGFQYLWWVEGYAKVPTFSGVDERVFSFKQEREQASIAKMILDSKDPMVVAKLSEQYDICFLFLDKNKNIDLSTFRSSGYHTIFDNLHIRIMANDCRAG